MAFSHSTFLLCILSVWCQSTALNIGMNPQSGFLRQDGHSLNSRGRFSHSARYEKALVALLQDKSKQLPSSTVEFLKSFRVCAACKKWERLGAASDGGYETCMDELESQSNIKAAFSMGVREEDQWSVDVNKRWQVPVYQFDCTVNSAQKCPDCHFFPKCIRSEDGSGDSFPNKSWTMKEVLANTKLSGAPERSLLMKMDIESSEWWVFEKEDADLLRKFRQIAVEFHVLRVPDEHERKLRAMRKLQQAGFVVAHIHGNNWAPFINLGGYAFPDVVEVIMVSDPSLRGQCNNHPGDFPGDEPNNPRGPLYPPAYLPAFL